MSLPIEASVVRRLGRVARLAAAAAGRGAGEGLAWAASRIAGGRPVAPRPPRSIVVVRNNDLGDLLVVTPLFAALRRAFPEAELVAAVGSWSTGLLLGNPHLSGVLPLDAPWFNKFVPHQSVLQRLRYLSSSPQVEALARRRFEVGIDVLGSVWGSLLLLRAGVPYRLGVRGYAGGHRGVQAAVTFDPGEHVGRSALRFAELLGATDLPPNRPQIFLSPLELAAGEGCWRNLFSSGPRARRVVCAPGGGLAVKCWPPESFLHLVKELASEEELAIAIAGGPGETELGRELAALDPKAVNLAGHLSLRETFALIAGADLVVCNSSVWMHAAAAFERPTIVLLGGSFPSAGQHDAQWGYPGFSRSLGKETDGPERIATVQEALAVVREALRAGPPQPRRQR